MSQRYKTIQTASGDILELDEYWVTDWVQFGIAELEGFLHRQAKFAEYCVIRDGYLSEDAPWYHYDGRAV